MVRLYFVSDTGRCWGDCPEREREKAIAAFEALGYRLCSREEYERQRKRMERQERSELAQEYKRFLAAKYQTQPEGLR
jgi:hypothetical protein